MREACNFHHRYTSTMTDKMRKKIPENHILINCTLYLTATLRLHDGKLIKDRLYHLRTYPNYFLAQELTDWLNSHKEALDRATVVCLLQHLMDMTLFCDKYPMFKDAKLLYGFRKDDGIFLNTVKAQGVAYQRSIPGCQRQGLELCRALLEHGIIHPVVRCYLLTFGPLHCISVLEVSLQTPWFESRLYHNQPACLKWVKGSSTLVFSELSMFSLLSLLLLPLSPVLFIFSSYSVLNRTSSSSSLLLCSLSSSLQPRLITSTVMGDAVGWGFVVRGMAPVYVQAVDPGSPAAAAAGVKVTQTYQVNWQSILHLDYCQVTRLVMTGPLHGFVVEHPCCRLFS
uniref:Si:dkeyp-97e7.9 n=1 Tax=Oncorhynchus tshawytscha TaxID=74940 RepID=A0AAZ3SVR1_ONCTS